MGKMTLTQLRKHREEKQDALSRGAVGGKMIQVIIGMGTCGIAAGARKTYDEILRHVEEHGLASQVQIRQTGCMGLCTVEPTVEVVMPGLPSVIYGKMTADSAKDLVLKHLVGKRLLNNHIFDRPAVDIIGTGRVGAASLAGAASQPGAASHAGAAKGND
ncbi:MAG: (2Fe-2S) ferredoxin domain-containing protein [Rectinemataceae bacterium]